MVGLSCAHYLLKRGFRVTLVERGGRDHDCCSLGNAGLISPSHFVPLAAPKNASLLYALTHLLLLFVLLAWMYRRRVFLRV